MKLQTRIALSASTFFALAVIVLTVINIAFQSEQSRSRIDDYLFRMAEVVAIGGAEFIEDYNVGELRKKLKETHEDPYFIYTYILDKDGIVLTNGTSQNNERDQKKLDLTDYDATYNVTLDEENGIFKVVRLVYTGSKVVGAVEFGYSINAIKDAQYALYKRNAITTFVLIVAGILGLIFLSSRLLRPLKKLRYEISDFDMFADEKYVSVVSRDEVGSLAESFNELVRKLRLTIASKDALDLEVDTRKNIEIELREAVKQAESAAVMKAQFLASMSHEIRTPMNGVIGMLGLLEKTDLNSDQSHKTHVAKSSAMSLLSLINDILDFSKVDAGKLDLEVLDINIQGLLGDTIESIAMRAQEKGVEIILDTNQVQHTWLKGDPGRIRQILNNLIGNAIKFTAEGEILIRCISHEYDEYVDFTCSVIDTGIGIPEEKRHALFSEFSQVDASTTREYGGTGLGLSISKKLTQLMDGDVEVLSRDDGKRGSEFRFHVHLLKGDKPASAVERTIDVRGLRVLIVDDNYTNLEVLRLQLESHNVLVDQAISAEQALQLCESAVLTEQGIYDAAILDMQMPKMDGEQLTKQLRSDNRFDLMQLIMMTSLVHDNDDQYFLDLGLHGFFPKPTTEKDIITALDLVAHNDISIENSLVTEHVVSHVKPLFESDGPLEMDCHILVVDDNQINQLVALGVLETLGFQADTAANGKEAIEAAKLTESTGTPYDLIFMDCQMPVMDGYMATQEIRDGAAGEKNKSVRIIAMTANAMQGDKERCLDSGMDDYIAKPISESDIREALFKWSKTTVSS